MAETMLSGVYEAILRLFLCDSRVKDQFSWVEGSHDAMELRSLGRTPYLAWHSATEAAHEIVMVKLQRQLPLQAVYNLDYPVAPRTILRQIMLER
jgi:hypothetical protein